MVNSVIAAAAVEQEEDPGREGADSEQGEGGREGADSKQGQGGCSSKATLKVSGVSLIGLFLLADCLASFSLHRDNSSTQHQSLPCSRS